MVVRLVPRLLFVAALAGGALPSAAQAQVRVLFHSFNGSVLFGRFPHAFIELTGTLDADGRPIHENYGYTAANPNLAALTGPVAGAIMVEDAATIRTTNVHFSVPISDAQYWIIRAEVEKWRAAPGKAYNLDSNNCVNFVARIAALVGLKADVPPAMERRPKVWLNYVSGLNPQLHAKPIN